MQNRIGGTAFVTLNGRQLALRGNMTIFTGLPQREGQAGLDGVHGYNETPQVPAIEGDFSTTPDLNVIEDLRDLDGATVTAELSNGKTYVLEQAWRAGPVDIQVTEGQVTLRFEGREMRELN